MSTGLGGRRDGRDVLRGVLLRRVPVLAGGRVKPMRLLKTVPTMSTEERGRLLDAAGIASSVFGEHVSKKWVFANVPRYCRHNVGRKVLYYEGEVRAWAETLREAA